MGAMAKQKYQPISVYFILKCRRLERLSTQDANFSDVDMYLTFSVTPSSELSLVEVNQAITSLFILF